MKDNIIKIDSHEQYMSNMTKYSLYVLYNRYIPNIRDGLTPVQRRILYCMYNDIGCVSLGTKRKSANTVGTVIAKYHSHGDSSVYGAMKSLTNPWEIKQPLLNYDSNSGSIQGGPQAASRYTESYLSKFSMDCVLGDLTENKQVVDWINTFDNHTIEPEFLPVKVPLLLINGTFGIATGTRIEVPPHCLNDVIDATITLLHDPNANIILIPDAFQKCDIVESDWKKISNTGYGHFIERGIIDIETSSNGTPYLRIRSTPDMVTMNSVLEKIEELIKSNTIVQIQDIQDHSTEYELDVHIILKKGSDPEFVKNTLYQKSQLQETKRVNLEVIDGTNICRLSYKAYILNFINFRKECKFRMYNFRLQKCETRLHQIEVYIKILESGEVEKIVHMIRNQNSMDESYLINWLMNKLKITDLQAKFVLHTEIGRLSKGHLNKYKEEQVLLISKIDLYINIIMHENLIVDEINQELLDIKAKYNQPHRSNIITEATANSIPVGDFKIIVTENNYIKKLLPEEPIKIIKGDQPKSILIADNSKDLILFDALGKVFRLQTSKISFTDKNSSGIDIRMLLKKATSNIISLQYEPLLKMLANKVTKFYIVCISENGYIKKINIDDILTAVPSGITYTKVNPGDKIIDIKVIDDNNDIVVYNEEKALRFSMLEVPYLKRSAIGNQTLKNVCGMSVINESITDIVVITQKGRFNRIQQSALARSSRTKAGSRVIRLNKGDRIISIIGCNANSQIKITKLDGIELINVNDLQISSSVSSGNKLTTDIIKAEIIV